MTISETISQTKKTLPIPHSTLYLARLSLSLSLFLLALLPRAYDLQRFVTADEAKWVYRSAQFLAALLRGDFPATSVNLTPAVTTTWLGSLGLAVYYQFNRAVINRSFSEWLISLPEFRVELDVLAAVRWPMVILTALSVVVIYLLLCHLFNPTLAFLAAAFIALDPHFLALSRIIGHDAPTAIFMTVSLLLLLAAVKDATGTREGEEAEKMTSPPRLFASAPLLLSGVAAGLAFLSKTPALFLIPFAGLVFISSETRLFRSLPPLLASALLRLFLWLVVAYLTFVIFWPAAWVDPVGRPLAVFQNAFLSATDQEEADEEGYWRVPDLGPFYYVVNGAFKLSPLVMVGVGLAVAFLASRRVSETANGELVKNTVGYSLILWLLAFVLLFTIFMTASDKRSARYILPIFPPLAIIAAFGWLQLYQIAGSRYHPSERSLPAERFRAQPPLGTLHASERSLPLGRFIFITLLTLCALVILLPYTPYYFTYFNPLLGGPYTAPRLVKIGWGEGLDGVGRFLQREGNLRGSRVGTAYASTVAPFFEGKLSGLTEPDLDYLVLYIKQIQAGEPSPAFIRYFEQTGSLFSVELNGIRYADVYPGPALQILTSDLRPPAPDPSPIAFRPLTLYGHIGEDLEVDVVWHAAAPPSTVPAVVSLTAPLAENNTEETQISQIPALAQAKGQLSVLTPNMAVSRHRLLLPAGLPRGTYTLWVEGHRLGEIELRNFQNPAEMNPVQDFVFGEQIGLVGYQFEPTTDYLGVSIAWQAQTSRLPDYTVFVQILEAETNERRAGVDTSPLKGEWPTSRWVKGEVVVDEYLVAIPPDFQPGFYKIIVGLYQPETGQRLTLGDGQDHWTLPWTFIRK